MKACLHHRSIPQNRRSIEQPSDDMSRFEFLVIVQIHVSCMYSSGKTCRPIEANLRHNTALSHHIISKCISIILIYHLTLKECWGSASGSLFMDNSANHRIVKKSGKSWDIHHVRALKDELSIQISWYGGSTTSCTSPDDSIAGEINHTSMSRDVC